MGSFRDFLRTLPAKDLSAAGLAKSDPPLPDITSWADLKRYLHPQGDAALVRGRAIWRSYQLAKRPR